MALSAVDRRVRLDIYERLAASGEAPSVAASAQRLDLSPETVAGSRHVLAEAHGLVTDEGTAEVSMAHPFGNRPSAYEVTGGDRSWWAPCAWDALSIGPLVGVDTTVRALCADCDDRITIEVRADGPDPGDDLVHLTVPPSKFWDDIGFT